MERFKKYSDYFYNLYDLGAKQVSGDYLDWKWKQSINKEDSFAFGLPTDIGPIAMIYRTDLFAKAGLPTDRVEVGKMISTWDDFLQAGMMIREKTGKAMIDNIKNLYRIIFSQGDQQYFDINTDQLIVETNPYVKRAWSYSMKAAELGLSAEITTYYPEWGAGMNKGDFAVVLAPAWMMGFMKGNAPDAAGKWDITALPEGGGNWGGSFLTMPKEGKHPQETFDLIKWLTAPAQQLKVFKTNGNFPSTPSIFSNKEFIGLKNPYFEGVPVGEIYSKIAKNVKPVYEGPDSYIVTTVMDEALVKVEKKQLLPEEAWSQAMSELHKKLYSNVARREQP